MRLQSKKRNEAARKKKNQIFAHTMCASIQKRTTGSRRKEKSIFVIQEFESAARMRQKYKERSEASRKNKKSTEGFFILGRQKYDYRMLFSS